MFKVFSSPLSRRNFSEIDSDDSLPMIVTFQRRTNFVILMNINLVWILVVRIERHSVTIMILAT